MKTLLPLCLALLLPLAGHASTVTSCNRELHIEQPPQRVVSHDITLTAMLLELGLRDRLIGYSGISGWKTLEPKFAEQLAGLPELSPRYVSLENLLQAQADFFFAGWNYGMRVGGEVTPASLVPFGIPVYELSESCGFIMPGRSASLDDLYADLRNLGRIFAVEARAEALVQRTQVRVAAVRARLPQGAAAPRIFLYDSGEDRPFTAGRQAMPQALIKAAGGRNVMQDVDASWTAVNWEAVVERDPEVIGIVDYGPLSAAQKRDFLLAHPALQTVTAIRERRFVVLSYLEATPSLDNAVAIEKLARALHPQAF
ncbi:ABC transporter substrate-binding protein [Aquipseudomonas alcaligenes]|uniref:ABC transporter substrate-binding protein n=1 Tax=Aquipseudomonas alcaligenes TaxID=43263 RepID=UPI003749AF30